MAGFVKHNWHQYSRMLGRSTPRKVQNLLLAKLSKRLRLERLSSRPYRYVIDPVNVCNLGCPLCPTGLGILRRRRGMLSFDQFQKLVDQIAPWCFLLELYNWGEPFLNPGIFRMIRYARSRRLFVRLSSNLNHFNEEMARETVASGLDCMIVSIDGATQATYGRYRRRGNLETVLANVRHLANARAESGAHHPLIETRMLVNRYNEAEIDVLRRMALHAGADVFTTGQLFVDTLNPEQIAEWLPSAGEHSAYGRANYGAKGIVNRWHCSDLWEGMVINWDGGVSPCCWVHDEAHDFANALDTPIAEIWNNDAFVESRRVFSRRAARANRGWPVCSQCRGRPQYLRI